MNKGIIYLIQPCELVGTNRYKIGCSKQNNLDRCKKGYKNGSRYICIMECVNALLLEKNIKDFFYDNFKLIGGNEYFEGNEDDIINEFFKKVNEYKENERNNVFNDNIVLNENNDNTDDDGDTNDNIDDDTNDNIDLIIEVFPNYKDDESFGGSKQLLKIKIEDYFINASYIDDKELIETNIYYIDDDFLTKYFKDIIKNNIIEDNCIYDLNDNNFIKKLNKHKEKININYCDQIELLLLQFKNIKFNSYSKVTHFLANNTILNEIIYCDIINLNNKSKLDIIVNFKITGDTIEERLGAIKIANKYYDYEYLRKYIPYCIELNKDTNEFYFINRDYVYIGLDTKDKPFHNEKNNYERLYLFNDGSSPFFYNNKKRNHNLKNIIIKYTEFNLNYKCLNINIQTQNIINLLKYI